MMRSLRILVAFSLLAGSTVGANAQESFTGRWSFSGLIMGGRLVTSFAQICDLQETGGQIAGPCHGPNGGCSLVGVVNGPNIDLTCRLTVPNNPVLSGVLSFHGSVAPDGIVRGACTHSVSPGQRGTAAMMRI